MLWLQRWSHALPQDPMLLQWPGLDKGPCGRQIWVVVEVLWQESVSQILDE